MIIDRYNEQAALAALEEPFIETRVAVSVKPEDEIMRFVQDVQWYSVNGWDYGPVPYAEFDDFMSGSGGVPDTTIITLDSRNIEMLTGTADEMLQSVLDKPLRDRPIAISILVLNTETKEVIGVIPRFVGIIDSATLTREKEAGARLEISTLSYRAFVNRRTPRVYGDTDHGTRFPGDRSMKWISDVVHRRGKYRWNSAEGAADYSINPSRLRADIGTFRQ